MTAIDRPVILMDMDGPLADLDKHLWKAIKGISMTMCLDPELDIESLDQQTHRFLSDHVGNRVVRQRSRERIDIGHWFAELPVVPGCIEGMGELLEVAEVFIVTKPLEANQYCRDDKAFWIRKNLGPEWEQRLIIAPDKSMIRGDALVDDAIKPEWVPRSTWKPIVFEAPFNGPGTKHGEDWDRFSWSDPVDKIIEMTFSR